MAAILTRFGVVSANFLLACDQTSSLSDLGDRSETV
jgi:hypothetical protein